jgi:hypothetical protein
MMTVQGIRRVAAAVTAVALALCWPAPAAAHRDIVLTVHTDGRGSVWVTATWGDGHPVTEPVGAMLVATSATGERVEPVRLRQTGDAKGTLVYENTLGAGDWTVVAETGQPAIARCEAAVRSAEGANTPVPHEVRCASAPAGEKSRTSSAIMVAVVAGVVVAVAFLLMRYRIRRVKARVRR